MNHVEPNIATLKAIVHQETWIAFDEINDGTYLCVEILDIAEVCLRRFGVAVRVWNNMTFGDLRHQLGI